MLTTLLSLSKAMKPNTTTTEKILVQHSENSSQMNDGNQESNTTVSFQAVQESNTTVSLQAVQESNTTVSLQAVQESNTTVSFQAVQESNTIVSFDSFLSFETCEYRMNYAEREG
jgi:hypothetical protein